MTDGVIILSHQSTSTQDRRGVYQGRQLVGHTTGDVTNEVEVHAVDGRGDVIVRVTVRGGSTDDINGDIDRAIALLHVIKGSP